MNEYYYLDMYGKLRFCNEDSLICAPLKTFLNDGSEFCELSGFESNHVSINCFNGHHSKKIASHRKLIKDRMDRDKMNKDIDIDAPSIYPTISSSDLHIHIHNVPSLQNLNL